MEARIIISGMLPPALPIMSASIYAARQWMPQTGFPDFTGFWLGTIFGILWRKAVTGWKENTSSPTGRMRRTLRVRRGWLKQSSRLDDWARWLGQRDGPEG